VFSSGAGQIGGGGGGKIGGIDFEDKGDCVCRKRWGNDLFGIERKGSHLLRG